MDVVLLERVENLGQIGDVVSVKPGYARNYLLPLRKALRATKDNMAAFEARKVQIMADNLKRKEEAQVISKTLEGLQIAMVRQAGESGQLYGSVSTRDIADGVTAAGTTVTRAQVALDTPIKTIGVHPARLVLHPEVSVDIVIAVAPSEDEAKVLLAKFAPKVEDAPAETSEGTEEAA